MYNEYPFQRETTLRHLWNNTIGCFSGAHHNSQDSETGDLLSEKPQTPKAHTPRSPLSPASWLKKLPEAFENPNRARTRTRTRMGRKHNRMSQSADFSYDPSSYALNFEDEGRSENEPFPFRDFSSRLPASPAMPLSPPLPKSTAAKDS